MTSQQHNGDPVAPKPRKLIRWDDEDRMQVATKYIKLCLQRNVSPLRHLGMSNTFYEAQRILSSSKHRPLASLTGSLNQAPIMKFVEKLLEGEILERDNAASLSSKKESEKHAPPPQTEPINEADIGSSLPHPKPKLELRKVEPEPVELPNTLEDMINGFAHGIAVIIVGEVVSQLKKEFLKEFPKLATRALQVTKTLPKILIVGPLPKQYAKLETAVDGVADIKFVSSEESPSLVALRGKSCVAALIWTNFISHPHMNAVKRIFNENNSRYVSGGLETLQTALEEIAIQIPEQS